MLTNYQNYFTGGKGLKFSEYMFTNFHQKRIKLLLQCDMQTFENDAKLSKNYNKI